MKYKEINELDSIELEKKLVEIKMELMKLNAQAATGTAPKNPNQIKQLKKTIAKIMTTKKLVAGENKKTSEKAEVVMKKNE